MKMKSALQLVTVILYLY